MEKIQLFGESEGKQSNGASEEVKVGLHPPLSPMKKTQEIEAVLSQSEDNESKLIALAQIIKKDRKKSKTLKQALAKEIELNKSLEDNIAELNQQMEEFRAEVKDKDERIVKTYADYMKTYEALLQLKNEKGIPKATRKPKKDKNKAVEGEKDIFDDIFDGKGTKAPRASVSKVEMTKHISGDIRKSANFFNMSGGPRKDSESSTEDDYIKELEEENNRLKSLMEYKDYELQKKKKEENFGFDCFSELREKFDISLQEANERIQELELQLNEKDSDMEELQIELGAKNEEIWKFEEKYQVILEQKDAQSRKEIEELKKKLTSHSAEIVDGFKTEIEELKTELKETQEQKNKYLDEKLKIEEVIDQQVDQIEFFNNKYMKLEDELKIRKQIEDEVTNNLRLKEEEVRVLRLQMKETTIRSFDVQFVNIEDAKISEEVLIPGTVQTWQSLENSKDYFLRISYKSRKDKNMKTFKVDADRLGGIIPITDNRAAIQWKNAEGQNKKQEVEIENIEDLLLEIGNLTYR